MDVYLVGGAVRDELLGLAVADRDWVVVGATAQELLAQGYQQVGRDFPVFLHPDTGEEYALARTERKTGPGHTGFVVHAGTDVSLEDDLKRRDLTINAMARSADGVLIDPWQGRRDLENRTLRHVSAAFAEDPLRVFRVARFAARFAAFEVAPETRALMADMGARGDLDELSAERVWTECVKALGEAAPERFFAILEQMGCLRPWFGELAGEHLQVPVALAATEERFAAVAGWLEPAACEALCERLACPRAYRRLSRLLAEHRHVLGDWRHEPAGRELDALEAARAFKPDSLLPRVAAVLAARGGIAIDALVKLAEDVVQLDLAARLMAAGHRGGALGAALRVQHEAHITAAQRQGPAR